MRRRRTGFSLIELTVVLTVLSLVWLSITCVLYTLYRAEHRLRDDLQREQAIDRLAARLRLDSHAATSAGLLELANSGHELALSTENERVIHYGISDAGAYRIVHDGDAVLHRDRFLIGDAAGEWELGSLDDRALIVLTLTSRNERTGSTRVWQIKAAVSTDRVPVAEVAEESL